MDEIQLTVLFATRNGAKILRRTLERYLELSPPSVGWELIVVDNGSTDASLEILESFASRLPLRILSEPRAGKNRAVNAGVEARRGELVVFTDDDILPDRAFLVGWEPVLTQHLAFDMFGGRIAPTFEQPPPAWLRTSSRESATMFAARDLPEGEVAAGEFYGGNMAVRTRVFDAGYRFDEDIGPNSTDADYPMGSETEFCFRLERMMGARGWFVRAPLVEHPIKAWQWTPQAWVRRSFRSGRGRAYIAQAHKRPVRRPALRWLDLLRIFSPLIRHRFRGLSAWHFRRGFDTEMARWSDRSGGQ